MAPDGIGRFGSLIASMSRSYQSLMVCEREWNVHCCSLAAVTQTAEHTCATAQPAEERADLCISREERAGENHADDRLEEVSRPLLEGRSVPDCVIVASRRRAAGDAPDQRNPRHRLGELHADCPLVLGLRPTLPNKERGMLSRDGWNTSRYARYRPRAPLTRSAGALLDLQAAPALHTVQSTHRYIPRNSFGDKPARRAAGGSPSRPPCSHRRASPACAAGAPPDVATGARDLRDWSPQSSQCTSTRFKNRFNDDQGSHLQQRWPCVSFG
jgi:hypothetical protein